MRIEYKMNYDKIPENYREEMQRYVEQGLETGRFLYSILTNNFHDAVVRADKNNLIHLIDFAHFIYNELPTECWGNKEKVDKWIEVHIKKSSKLGSH